ncbi:hypothetical protein JL720_4587 [Aureococcus anophagefferens]|nr:hypothetical protein JL720_4587 [Aureococcus anophagefferens]
MPAAAPETPGEMERSSFGGLMELLAGGLGGSPGGDSVTPSEQMRYESPTKDGDSPTSERMRLGSFQASEDLDGSATAARRRRPPGSFELLSPGGAPGSEDAWRGARELGDDLEADAEADEAPRVNYAMMATALSPRRRAASPRGAPRPSRRRAGPRARGGARGRAAVARRRRPAVRRGRWHDHGPLSAKAAAPPALQALLAAKARPFDDESEVDDSDGGESEGQGFALPDWPAYRRKTVWKTTTAPRGHRRAPKYILNRPDADAPANRPPRRGGRRLTRADGAVAAPPEDAPEPGGATAAYVFESRFESGNLLHAAVVERDYGGAEPSPSGEPYPDAEFDCAMCPDVGTGGHTQWFYFRVDGLRKGVRYRFNVTNFAKADSLYLEGMQPLVGRRAAVGRGWRRAGKVVCYSKNTAEAHRQQVADMRRASGLAIDGGDDGEESSAPGRRKKKEAEKPNAWRKEEKRRQRGRRGTHTLSFDLTLDDDEPSLYLAYSHPYTYTDLQAFLATLAADPARSATYTRRSLCDTVAGNRCDLLTITAPPAASAPAEAPPPGAPATTGGGPTATGRASRGSGASSC